MVGTSGSASDRVVVVTPSARSLPALMYSMDEVAVVAARVEVTPPPVATITVNSISCKAAWLEGIECSSINYIGASSSR